jgi:hypothetical protein
MSVQRYAFTCGPVTGDFAHLMEGGEGGIRVPIPVALIEHQKGRALFDTGLHPDCRHDPEGCLGARIAPLFRIGLIRAKRSARGSKRSDATRRASISSSNRISISTMSAAVPVR